MMTTGCDTTKPTHARDPQPCSDDRDAARQLRPALDDFIAWLQQHCGIDFTGYKPGTLARRIQQRLLATGQTDLEAYRHYLETHADEREALNQCLLINVTEFFRDPEVCQQLADTVLPDLLRGRHASDELRLWSAGCASGEEAYTLAMLALDAASRFGFNGNVKVFATDLQASALSQASSGLYSQEAVARIPEPLLRRFFQQEADGWRADASLRRHLVFAQHNLLADPPFTHLDLVACRNLLIYLQPEAQHKALAQLHFALKPQGLLLLGQSESLGELEGRSFMTIDRTAKLFRRLPDAPLRIANTHLPRPLDPHVPSSPASTGNTVNAVNAADHAHLQAELQATRERLHEMIAELQNRQEHIDLTNEELTAANEELQSTNEELQSVNENLNTLNAQLAHKNTELTQFNRDYDHLLASAEIGTLFLDAELHVRRFSPSIHQILTLRPQDLGRSITEFSYHLGAQRDFIARLQQVATTGERNEREIRLSTRADEPTPRWLQERILPFIDSDGVRDGVVVTYTDISSIKASQAQAAQLAEERTRLQNILDALPDGIYIVSPQYDIEYLNPVLEGKFGAPNGRKCHQHFHGLSLPCSWCKNQAVFAGNTVRWEMTVRNGETYELLDLPLRNADGSLSKFEVVHDITAMRHNQQKLTQAAALAHVGDWQWDATTNTLHWGDETYRIFGLEPAHYAPTYADLLQRVHEEDRERVAQGIASTLQTGQAFRCEFRYWLPDGSLRHGQVSGELEYDDQKNAHMLMGAMQDITELRTMEQALHASEQLFATALQAAPHAGIISRERDGLIIECNERLAQMFGSTRAELLGKGTSTLKLWRNEADRQQWLARLNSEGCIIDFECDMLDKDEARRQLSISTSRITVHGEAHLFTFIHDITERKAAEAHVDYLAHHDALTGLPNRLLLRERFSLAAAWAERNARKVALLFLDLDHFKAINDSLGHPAGDALLQLIADRLRLCARDTDTISRLGGDEFLIVLADIDDAAGINAVADKLLSQLAEPFELEGRELTNTLSLGIAVFPDDGRDFDTLLQKADTALYQAKEAGRNTCRFYTEQMNVDALERLQIKAALHHALQNQEFELHYQPQIDLASGRVIGCEALLRWRRSDGAMVPPFRFIPHAEESGLIVPIGDWVLQEACHQAMRWQATGLPAITMAVNLSAVQFHRGDIEKNVLDALSASRLAPDLLELELTESLLLANTEAVLDSARRLKSLGVQLSIDDFGTGYSSLAYLKRFAVDKLKIDQSFVRDIVSDPEDAAIVRAIIGMAHALKLKVIAEGVETADIARFLGLYLCHEAQGYHYARPMPAAEFATWHADWLSQHAQTPPTTQQSSQ